MADGPIAIPIAKRGHNPAAELLQIAGFGSEDDVQFIVKNTFIDDLIVVESPAPVQRRRSCSWPRVGHDNPVTGRCSPLFCNDQSPSSTVSGGASSRISWAGSDPLPQSRRSSDPLPQTRRSSDTTSSRSSSDAASPRACASQVFPERERLVSLSDDEAAKQSIWWMVDSAKLRGNFTGAVSKSFEIRDASGALRSFIMIISPKLSQRRGSIVRSKGVKGAVSFRAANSQGIINLKCKADSFIGSLKFQLSIGHHREDCGTEELPRGPVEHDFSQSSVGGLKLNDEVWDFKKFVDSGSSTFMVCLDVFF